MSASEPIEQAAIQARIGELRSELAKGEQQLCELETEHARVRDAVLRIHGAIVVLEELRGPCTEQETPPQPLANGDGHVIGLQP